MTAQKKVLLFNPRSNDYKPRIPNSILQVAASIEGKWDYVIVDGNLEVNPWNKIYNCLLTGDFFVFGCTVMPGPQLRQAIPYSEKIKDRFPGIKIVWGGYFASNQHEAVLNSGYVDFVINGMGDKAFPSLLGELGGDRNFESINNLIFADNGNIIYTPKDEIYDLDLLPPLPYEKLNAYYPIQRYLGKTYLGTKTIAYHSSFGCPFTCSFCAVVPIYKARWKGKSAQHIYDDISYLKNEFGGNAIEFHDNNFFVSERRTVEFSEMIKNENMIWWGEGRIDTLDKYSDKSLELIREAGCRMIFFGAETGNDTILKKMDKGGTQTGEQIKKFAARLMKFDIIPEYSFVLGTPAESESEVWKQIMEDISFIREIKEINPCTEIIIYIYSPVPTEGSALFNEVSKAGFKFPVRLKDWLEPQWENFDLRKNPLTPWLTAEMVDYIKNFETVINGKYPTVSDYKLSSLHRRVYTTVSDWRYKNRFYKYPFEIKLLNKIFKYRQPEKEGF